MALCRILAPCSLPLGAPDTRSLDSSRMPASSGEAAIIRYAVFLPTLMLRSIVMPTSTRHGRGVRAKLKVSPEESRSGGGCCRRRARGRHDKER
jgi:hypothetical protein